MKIKNMKMIITAIAILSIGVSGIAAAQSRDGQFIVMLGAPAAGKSVNSEWMSKAYGIPWINIGEVLRAEVEKVTKKTRHSASTQHKRGAASTRRSKDKHAALEKLKNGELVSNDSLNALVASRVLSSDASDGFILDGYPMTVEQAEFLDSILEVRGISGLKVIYLNVSDEVSLKRMKDSKKSEYKSGIGKERLKIFRSMVGPLAEYYGEEMVFEIDAAQSQSAVSAEIVSVVEK
jgi:adenylate kinase